MARGKRPPSPWYDYIRPVLDAQAAAKQQEAEAAERKRQQGPRQCHYYRRVSHEDSKRSGLGLREQKSRVEAYWNCITVDYQELKPGQWFEDLAVSGRVPLKQRKAGSQLDSALRSGDHVVFARLDRAFRNVRDLVNTMHEWERRGVHVHFADLRLDLSTASGQLIMHVMAAVAHWEAQIDSERNLEIAARMRAERGVAGGRAPLGYRWVGPKGKRRLERNVEQQRTIEAIVRARNELRMSWPEVAEHIERLLASEQGRPVKRLWEGVEWSVGKCQRAYRMTKKPVIAKVRVDLRACADVDVMR